MNAPDDTGRRASLADRLRGLFEGLGKQEQSVAREMLRDYPLSALSTMAGLAEQSGASTATVLRLSHRLGFTAFSDCQDAVKSDLDRLLRSPSQRFSTPQRADGEGAFVSRMFAASSAALAGVVDQVVEADFRKVVAALADPRRGVCCVGGRYGRHVAGLLADNLGVLRGGVRFAGGQPDGWSRLLLEIGPQSVVVVIDIRRHQRTVRRFADLAAERGAMVVLITDPWAAPRDFAAHYVFRLPTATPSLMDSYAAPLLMAEALVGAVATELGPDLQARLASCEALDCVESDLSLAWPGIEQQKE